MLLAARVAPAASRRLARSAAASAGCAAAVACTVPAAAAVAVPPAAAAVAARCISSMRPARCSRLTAAPAASASSSLLRLLPRRSFASITLTPTTSREFDSAMTLFLECLLLALESPRFESHNLDLTLADGVLSVASPERGTWVLNKHGPTRQIWLSSPLSGPRKFNLHWEAESAGMTHPTAPRAGEGWLGERDTSDALKARLIAEWNEAFGVQIDPVKDFDPAEHK